MQFAGPDTLQQNPACCMPHAALAPVQICPVADTPSLANAGVVRHRRGAAAVGARGHVRDWQDPRQGDPEEGSGEVRLPAR